MKEVLYFSRQIFRKDIGRRLIAKTGHVIKKFVQEIEDAEKNFRALNQNPPVAENLPPISGDKNLPHFRVGIVLSKIFHFR
jgi:hypothetical protein